MSLFFKNLKATIDGQDYYAESVDLSESISIETFSALGTKGAYAFPSNKPEGSMNMTFYLTTGTEISNIEDQYGKTGFVDLKVGPFEMDFGLLNSFSVQADANSMIKGSVSYNYYGQMSSGSTPTKGTAEIVPAHGAASSGDFSDIGISEILNFDYSFSQSHEVQYGLGNNAPSKVVFNEASKELSVSAIVSDVDFSQTDLTGVNALCDGEPGDAGFTKKNISVTLNNLCQENVGSLSVSGYLSERSIGVEPGGEVVETVKVIEKFVRDANCDE